MSAPWTYRPASEDDLDWEDNAVSNTMAWLSDKLTPTWCSDEDHWTVRLTAPLWAECYCCVAFRWTIIGVIIGLPVGLIL